MRKVCLVILDGYGIVEKQYDKMSTSLICDSLIDNQHVNRHYSDEIFLNADKGDAVKIATAQGFKNLFNIYPSTLLYASGNSVGLPNGQMGNSEVGHMNIGAGRIVLQDFSRINKAFNEKTQEVTFLEKKFFQKNKKLHVIGLVSNGNVHSSVKHLEHLISLAKSNGCKLYIHAITDGRDTDVNAGEYFIKQIEDCCNQNGCSIASLSGRYYAMDRENNLDRTKMYFDVLFNKVNNTQKNAREVIVENYKNGVTDEFIKPVLLDDRGTIEKGDNVLFFNFRADRMRQIVQMVLNQNICNVFTMTEYSDNFKKAKVVFKNSIVENTLSEVISEKGLTQLKVAELSKYAHVTYFLNGGLEKPFKKEKRILVPMADVATFDLYPQMSAKEVTLKVIEGMDDGIDFICVNYANCDMVGHTGNFDAACKAVSVVTNEVLKLVEKSINKDYTLVVTADHGNAEVMIKDDRPCTTHTTSRVPFIVINHNKEVCLKENGALCSIMPTILDIIKG